MARQGRSTMAMVGDSPTPEKDLLHFTRYVQPLVELITGHDTETPFTIGIYGKWGTGKTTLLRMIEKEVSAKGYPTVWFNPWLYQMEDNLVLPLLRTIHDSLQDSPVERFKATAGRVASVVTQVAASVLLRTVTLGHVSLKDVKEGFEDYEKQHAEAISYIRKLRDDLQGVVNDLTDEGKSGRLLLYIDDLDRCVPQKIIGLLEAIKLFLDLNHTILFLAIDKEIVQQGIQVFYKDFKLPEEEYGSLTADYMDKMIQLPLHLHPLGPEQVGDYLQQLSLSTDLANQRELFQRCLQPNPRKIKRVLNIITLNARIVDSDPHLRNRLKKSMLAKLIIMQQQWYDLYRYAVAHRELPYILEQVYRGELLIHEAGLWADEPRKSLRQLVTQYYNPSSQLAHLFTYGDSFKDTALDEYLFLLG